LDNFTRNTGDFWNSDVGVRWQEGEGLREMHRNLQKHTFPMKKGTKTFPKKEGKKIEREKLVKEASSSRPVHRFSKTEYQPVPNPDGPPSTRFLAWVGDGPV